MQPREGDGVPWSVSAGTLGDAIPEERTTMILRSIAKNALRAALLWQWPAFRMYVALWRECRKPTPF
jgi:hypothetical protein